MAITNYSTLVEAVGRWAGGSSDTNFQSAIADAVSMCEVDLDRRLRIPEMVTRVTATMNEPFETLPNGVVKMIYVARLVGGVEQAPALVPVSEDKASALSAMYPTGTPQWYSLTSTQIRIVPAPTEASPCTVRAVYYGPVPRLSAVNACTAVLLAAPDAYLYGTLSHLAEYVEDSSRLQRFAGRFQSAVAELNRASVLREASLVL